MSDRESFGYENSHRLLYAADHPDDKCEDSSDWLKQTDIVEHDFPYVARLLAESFEDWSGEWTGIGAFRNWQWCVLDHNLRMICASPGGAGWTMSWGAAAEAAEITGGMCLLKPADGTICAAVPVLTRLKGERFAYLCCAIPEEQTADSEAFLQAAMLHYRACFYRRFEHMFVADLTEVQRRSERESGRHSLLFQIVQRMHDHIDVEIVLTEVINSLTAMFPGSSMLLYMSQDHKSAHPQVKTLPLHWPVNDVRARAFKTGKVAVQSNQADGRYVEIGLPLGGKQGVYGVFHLIMFNPAFSDLDLRFLTMAADTAGTAFENAKLYERSNQLIRELRMSNELTRRLNQSLQLKDVFKVAYEGLMEMFQADYCCILHMKEEKGGLETVICNKPEMERVIVDANQGLGGKVYATGEPVILAEYSEAQQPESQLMRVTGSQSAIAVPLTVGGVVRGVIILTHRLPRYFSFDSFRLLQAMAGHIGLAVGNALLHAEVRRLANRDSLTGLYARHYLDEEIIKRQSSEFCGSLIIVDIDEFKQVNDTYGHQKGDAILGKVSEVIRSSIRQGDIAARWGGEELAIYLPQLGVKQASAVAERIRLRVQAETDPAVTVSCGIAEWSWTDDVVSVDSLFYRADMALYRAKDSGRNRVEADLKSEGPRGGVLHGAETTATE